MAVMPLQFQSSDISGSLQRGQQFDQQNALANMQINRAQNQMAQEEQVRNALANMPENPGRGFYNTLAQQGDPGLRAASQLESIFGPMDEQQRQEKLRVAKENAMMLRSVQDQDTYNKVREYAISQSPQAAQGLPEQYDPAIVQAMIQRFESLSGVPAGLQEFQGLTKAAGLQPGSPEFVEAANMALGRTPKAGTISKDERIASTPGSTETVAESQAIIKDRVKRAEEDAKNATGQVKEYFDQLGNIERNISNYNEAIATIDAGAETGAIQSKLPSVKAASVKLDNVIGRLGLDVIGNTTFGALSEAELAFALNTAGPGKLDGPELKQWFVDKRDSQQKLADYISNAIQFLSIPGNSLSDLQAQAPRQNAIKNDSRGTSKSFDTMSDAELLDF